RHRKLKQPPQRAGTKQAMLIAMLQRPEGATIAEIVAATSWQSHTARGSISGVLRKKLGFSITSEKIESRGSVYRIGVKSPLRPDQPWLRLHER
ncbi:MAG: DUF3489 domain-containing protein, partial [Mycobacterium sp.]|nr:DUF3489 domain-containing protein [Mycobacterium sp.]